MPAKRMHNIRKATPADQDGIWEIFQEVVKEGDTYTYPPDIGKEEALSIWMSKENFVYVVEAEGSIVGTYNFHANFPGAGAHIANASFMVGAKARGMGLGKAMANHALSQAKEEGFLAMQFNLVISTNDAAVRLWKKVGFEIIGTIPEAFRHPAKGLVDAFIMYRKL